MANDDLHEQLHDRRDHVLDVLRGSLRDIGLHFADVESISFFVKKRPGVSAGTDWQF